LTYVSPHEVFSKGRGGERQGEMLKKGKKGGDKGRVQER